MIGILNAYHWDGNESSYQVQYRPMFKKYLEEYFNEEVRFYELPTGDFPQSTSECRAWFIGGSAKSCYESDSWIQQLKELVIEFHSEGQKLIGLCFGHQIIALALGGKVEKSSKGWGIGIREFEILRSESWMEDFDISKKIGLLYSHQDQVIKLPRGAKHIGRSDFCEHESYQIGENILCFQGHPEFTKPYAETRYRTRIERIGSKTVDAALQSLLNHEDDKLVWNWIKNFLG